MRFDAGEILQVEEDLAAGRTPSAKRIPLLLEALQHLRTCPGASVKRKRRRCTRGHRRRCAEEKKGHGRNAADDYPGAEHVDCPHPDYKPGDPCPLSHCNGHLYHSKTAADVELKAGPLVDASVYERHVLRCSSCQATFTAPLPPQAHGEKYHPSVDAAVAVARYEMGMPHYRLARWQKWAGIPLPASTQFERMEAQAKVLLPIFLYLKKQAAHRAVLAADDTGARILSLAKENETKGPKERTGIFTTAIVATGLDGKLATIVLFKSGRSHQGENMDRLLRARCAEAGLPIYVADAAARTPNRPRIPANCLTHARQYFVETFEAFPQHSRRVLDDIATIYRNDDVTLAMDPASRLAYHQQHSEPVMTALYKWIDEQLQQRLVEPNGRLGKAFKYMTRHWTGLTRFLHVPGVPLDNNLTERQIKTSVRHRKCSLFYRNEAGADIGDVLMSVIRTCVVNGYDPMHYLTAVGMHAIEARAAPQAWLPWTYKTTLASLN